MTADFINILFLGAITYLVHSSVFLLAALGLTSGKLIRNIALKEMILRFALVAGLVTAPLQMSGAFDPLARPIAIPEEAVVAETPVFEPRAVFEPRTEVAEQAFVSAPEEIARTPAVSSKWSTATITLIVWAFFGLALLFQRVRVSPPGGRPTRPASRPTRSRVQSGGSSFSSLFNSVVS